MALLIFAAAQPRSDPASFSKGIQSSGWVSVFWAIITTSSAATTYQ
jgi:hypothetical protein